VVVASAGVAFGAGVIGTPGVVAVENRFGDVSNRTTVIETDMVVNNPNPIGVQLSDTTINYTVGMNNVSIAAGDKEGVGVDPGNTTLNFTTQMQNTKIPEWWVTHVRNDERTTVDIDARARTGLLGGRVFPFEQTKQIETDIIGQFNSDERRPVNSPQTQPGTENPVLFVEETRASYGTVTDAETPIDMRFTLYNPKLQPYTITEVGYEITMNGVDVGAGATDDDYAVVIPPDDTETLDTRTAIANAKLDDWWVSHLENNQVTDLRIDFYAKVELPTDNEVRVPLDQLTYEKRIETDIFGNKDENENTNGNPDGTTTPTATPTPDGGPNVGGTDVVDVTSTPTLNDSGGAPTPTDDLLSIRAPEVVG
jgi:LEA14-like dessication related protein